MSENKTKWTPGPWLSIRQSNSIIAIQNESKAGEWIYNHAHILQPRGYDEQKANARLIVAAPEMADLIYRLDRAVGNGNGRVALDTIANEAGLLLAKIKGE